MSSLGSQWRNIRHYLSLTNLHSEVEKLLQKIKPATPEQWENLITRFEKAVQVRLASSAKEIEKVNEASSMQQKEDTKQKEQNVPKTSTVEKDEKILTEKPERSDKKLDEEGLLVGSEAKEITLEGLWQGLKLKKDLHFGKISEPSWKDNKPAVTKTSIHSRTAYVISALAAADTRDAQLRRAEALVTHLHQFPEARDYAIKEGAVRALLRVQYKCGGDAELAGALSEALALVGELGGPRGPGPAVLALDGGGIRGLVAIEVLRALQQAAGRPLTQLFDLIVGVSTGAIIAALIGSGMGTLDTAEEMYQTLSKKMFGNTSVIGGASRLVWTHSYYDTAAWEQLLQEHLGERTLSQCNRIDAPKLALVSCVVGGGARAAPFVFRSYVAGRGRRSALAGTSSARLWQAVRASAAAPTYFQEFRLRGALHQDGGLCANNPAALAAHETRLAWGPRALLAGTLVSVGTGRAPAPPARRPPPPPPTSWRDKFYHILDSATDTEGVHRALADLMPPDTYYRLNPPLRAVCAMDETGAEALGALREDARLYVRRNRHKLDQVARRLLRPRPLVDRAADTLRARAKMLGLAT